MIITKKNVELYKIIENGKLGYIDQKGNIRIEPKFELGDDFYSVSEFVMEDLNGETFAIVKEDEGYILMDWRGRKTTKSHYQKLTSVWDSTFLAMKNDKYGLIHYNGEIHVPFIFDTEYFINHKRIFPAKIEGRQVIYTPDEIIKTKYENIYPFIGGYATVEKNDKKGLINENLELKFNTKYEDLGTFSSGLINVKINNKWYYFNQEEKQVLDSCYEKASSFQNGIAIVKNEKYGVIDTLGNFIMPSKYEYLEYCGKDYKGEHVFMFCDNEDYFLSETKCGLINLEGDQLLKAEYNDLYYFFDIVEALNHQTNKYGVIDLRKRKVIVPFNFDDLEYYENNISTLFFSDEEGNEYFGYITNRNNIVWSNNEELLAEKLKTNSPNKI
ncbi:MAG: WG repeat-containing protein [Jejuia sp.]